MTIDFHKTRTYSNLSQAFVSESVTKVKYEIFSNKAKNEGFLQIADIFAETANNELEHAKRFYKFIEEYSIKDLEKSNSLVRLPIITNSTKENLYDSFCSESHESGYLYPLYAKIAKHEGYEDIAYTFQEVAEAEERHEERFKKLYDNVINDLVFKKDSVVLWKCNNCGYIHKGLEAPDKCPACDHEQKYFEVFKETY